MKKRLVVLTGAGISAESGLSTFRDSDGLWEKYSVEDVATIEGWHRNPTLVLDFYNLRKVQALEAIPNEGHRALARLEYFFETTIITQNVDSLHEKAGSRRVCHLHGQLSQVKSEKNPKLVYEYGNKPIFMGDTAEDGAQLRPNVVWFGEEVPMIELALSICVNADIFVVIGTSLQVYPAAGLIDFVPPTADKFLIDPNASELQLMGANFKIIKQTASTGVPELEKLLLKEYL